MALNRSQSGRIDFLHRPFPYREGRFFRVRSAQDESQTLHLGEPVFLLGVKGGRAIAEDHHAAPVCLGLMW